MATKSIHIRIDEKQKKKVESALEEMGLDLTTVVRVLLKKIEITGNIPFSIGKREDSIDYYTPQQIAILDQEAIEASEGKNIAASFTLPKEKKMMSTWLKNL